MYIYMVYVKSMDVLYLYLLDGAASQNIGINRERGPNTELTACIGCGGM